MKPMIPQGAPIVMVDDVTVQDEAHATTRLMVSGDKYIDGEAALVEHAAQSCAALIGSRSGEANVGYIGEVKQFRIERVAKVGEVLESELEIVAEMDGVSLVEVKTRVGEEVIAEGKMKLFVND